MTKFLTVLSTVANIFVGVWPVIRRICDTIYNIIVGKSVFKDHKFFGKQASNPLNK